MPAVNTGINVYKGSSLVIGGGGNVLGTYSVAQMDKFLCKLLEGPFILLI